MYVGYDNSVSSLHLRYNLGHNILELYNDLVQIRLSTSKTKRDILQTCKLGIWVASQFAEWLLRPRILANKEILGEYQIRVKA